MLTSGKEPKCTYSLFLGVLMGMLLCSEIVNASGWSTTDDFPYTLRLPTELAIIPSGATVLALGIFARDAMEEHSREEILGLDRANVPIFDRRATYNDSRTADKISDIGLISMQYMPLLFAIREFRNFKHRWRNVVTLAVMFGEATMWTTGVTNFTKALIRRPRPLMYNNQVSMAQKLDSPFTSFFSGHTSDTFCNAVFVATVFSDMYPRSPWRFVVWGASMAVASTTGAMRFVAGKHFPSDILTGAVVGSLVGYLAPLLHRKNLWNQNTTTIAVLPDISKTHAGFTLIFGL